MVIDSLSHNSRGDCVQSRAFDADLCLKTGNKSEILLYKRKCQARFHVVQAMRHINMDGGVGDGQIQVIMTVDLLKTQQLHFEGQTLCY